MGGHSYEAEAHAGAEGSGNAACSGDLLLEALAACAQITCQMVATSMKILTESIEAVAEGDFHLAGTLASPRRPRSASRILGFAFRSKPPKLSPNRSKPFTKRPKSTALSHRPLRGLRPSKRNGCARKGSGRWPVGPLALRQQLFLYPDGEPGPEYPLQALPERDKRASHEAVGSRPHASFLTQNAYRTSQYGMCSWSSPLNSHTRPRFRFLS